MSASFRGALSQLMAGEDQMEALSPAGGQAVPIHGDSDDSSTDASGSDSDDDIEARQDAEEKGKRLKASKSKHGWKELDVPAVRAHIWPVVLHSSLH